MKNKKKFSTGAVVAAVISAVVLGFVGFISIIVASVFHIAGKASPEADQFLKLIGDGKVAAAYESTAFQYRSLQSADAFEKSVEDLNLNSFQKVFWSKRSIHKDHAERDFSALRGNVTTAGGDKIPFSIQLIRDGRTWKVLSFAKTENLDEESPGIELADSPELHNLARSSVRMINRGIVTGDFTELYRSLAGVFRNQTTPDVHRDQFTELVKYDLDFSNVTDQLAVFSEAPQIDSNGKLLLKGEFDVHPRKAAFEFICIFEDEEWKLISYNIFSYPNPPSIPSPAVIDSLTRSALTDLSDAFKSGDFTTFTANASNFFRQDYTAENVREAFIQFVEEKIDISGADQLEIAFTEEPGINEEGILTIFGTYRNTVNIVTFDIACLLEDSEWKLITINVATEPINSGEATETDPVDDLISFLENRFTINPDLDPAEFQNKLASLRRLISEIR
ncbi:MAG: hypothetical protein P1V20_21490 [Verrucomicrobiales bacterium]|nr:hypothetical protein [Verrucomicrobiales bacterium]